MIDKTKPRTPTEHENVRTPDFHFGLIHHRHGWELYVSHDENLVRASIKQFSLDFWDSDGVPGTPDKNVVERYFQHCRTTPGCSCGVRLEQDYIVGTCELVFVNGEVRPRPKLALKRVDGKPGLVFEDLDAEMENCEAIEGMEPTDEDEDEDEEDENE